MAAFKSGEQQWIAKLGNLRNIIRQELIGSQLDEHIDDGSTVLDVGCGQGTQGLRLLKRGCLVTGVEPSSELRQRFVNDAVTMAGNLDLIDAGIDDLDLVLGDRSFDAVCTHGLLMYLGDTAAAVSALSARVATGGLLSLTVKNTHGLAMRPALRGDWASAIAAFKSADYQNELGVKARSHRLDEVEQHLDTVGFEVAAWYGIRVFNDAIAGDVDPPPKATLDQLLEAETRAARSDPYRWLGSQLHIIAHRSNG